MVEFIGAFGSVFGLGLGGLEVGSKFTYFQKYYNEVPVLNRCKNAQEFREPASIFGQKLSIWYVALFFWGGAGDRVQGLVPFWLAPRCRRLLRLD